MVCRNATSRGVLTNESALTYKFFRDRSNFSPSVCLSTKTNMPVRCGNARAHFALSTRGEES
jgi:hypothetical protein